MNYMEEKLHALTLAERKKCCATGVAEVDGMSDEKITVTLFSGERVSIVGKGLKIANFSKQTGALAIDGEVNCVQYLGEKVSFFKKLLK